MLVSGQSLAHTLYTFCLPPNLGKGMDFGLKYVAFQISFLLKLISNLDVASSVG